MPVIAARAHVHGEGELGIAIEAGRVDLSLVAPEADVKSDTKESLEALEARFEDAKLFIFEGAACRLIASSVGYADDDVAGWTEPEEHKHTDHHDHDENQTDDDGHSDRLMTWTYQCTNDPVRLTIGLFDATHLESIRVQAIGESGAATAEVTAENRQIALP